MCQNIPLIWKVWGPFWQMTVCTLTQSDCPVSSYHVVIMEINHGYDYRSKGGWAEDVGVDGVHWSPPKMWGWLFPPSWHAIGQTLYSNGDHTDVVAKQQVTRVTDLFGKKKKDGSRPWKTLCRCNVTLLLFKINRDGSCPLRPIQHAEVEVNVCWQHSRLKGWSAETARECLHISTAGWGEAGLEERGAGGHRDGRVEEPMHKLMTVSGIKIIQIHNPR